MWLKKSLEQFTGQIKKAKKVSGSQKRTFHKGPYENPKNKILSQFPCMSENFFWIYWLSSYNPANTRLDEDVLKTFWRCLSSSSSEDVFKTPSRRLYQDEYVRLSLTSSEDVFKTSWSRPIYSPWLYVFKTSSRRFQDVFKTFSRPLQHVWQKRLQDIFKAFWRRLQNVFKTSSRRPQGVSSS